MYLTRMKRFNPSLSLTKFAFFIDRILAQLEAMNKRLHGQPTEAYNEKFADLERGMKQLERKLKEGSALETGQRGSNKVSTCFTDSVQF